MLTKPTEGGILCIQLKGKLRPWITFLHHCILRNHDGRRIRNLQIRNLQIRNLQIHNLQIRNLQIHNLQICNLQIGIGGDKFVIKELLMFDIQIV